MFMSKVWTTWQDNGAVAAEGSNGYTTPCSASPAEPAGRNTAGISAFPDNFPKIFPLRQNTVSLVYHLTKHFPRSAQRWKQVRHVLQKEAMRAKERKEALWKFLGLDNPKVIINPKVLIQPKVQRFWESLAEKKGDKGNSQKKTPPLHSAIWLLGVVPAFRRAPNLCLRVAG
ncbi:MAG: hypothetical protein YPKNTGVA_002124 [Candidatus Fervidibacter sp.]